MNQNTLWEQYTALPADVRREVDDFIAFLATRYAKERKLQTAAQQNIVDDPSIGMWSDRTDIGDSSTWVRDIRQKEWEQRHD